MLSRIYFPLLRLKVVAQDDLPSINNIYKAVVAYHIAGDSREYETYDVNFRFS